MRFILGLLLIIAGALTLRYRYEIHNFTGNWGWAEEYLGGTINAISLFGALFILIGTAYPLGAFEGVNDDENLKNLMRKPAEN